MALTTTASVLGDSKKYQVSPQCKKYTLMDTGFIATKSGNFQLERALDPNSPYQASFKLKITIAKDLKSLKMSVTSANGLQAIDIFKAADTADNVTQFQYVIDNLLERLVLEAV